MMRRQGGIPVSPPTTAAPDEADRVRLGAGSQTPVATMRVLASDPSVRVRATLAMNTATPPEIDRTLAADADERVRILLAHKLGALVPRLSGDMQARLQHQALETLTALVQDEAVRVRAAIAQEIKDLPDAPRAIILQLIHDPAVMVCEPVIRFSPTLAPEDLLALLAAAPSPPAVLAVARRPGITEAVAEAVAATANAEAIRALLENHSAQLQEATLDALVAQAADHSAWHEPLVRRPSLPTRAAHALSKIVATHLLEVLAARSDLDPLLARELRNRLGANLAPMSSVEPDQPNEATALAIAHGHADAGTLNEDLLLEAARRGDVLQASALLAVAAGVPIAAVTRASALRSGKGIVSLVWRAGFTMRAAIGLQTLLARLSPATTLRPSSTGGFPLTSEEMRWQLDFLARAGR